VIGEDWQHRRTGANHGVFLAASLTNHMCMPSGRCKSVLGRARVCVSVIAPKSLTSLILVAWPLLGRQLLITLKVSNLDQTATI
jgi:hypothetical protein